MSQGGSSLFTNLAHTSLKQFRLDEQEFRSKYFILSSSSSGVFDLFKPVNLKKLNLNKSK